MSYRHPSVLEWEAKLKDVFDRIDAEMEREYGGRYPLHPARPAHATTANPEDDGLFDLGAAFSAGFGSGHGRGYLVQVRLATLKRVPADVMEEIERKVAARLRDELPRVFPGRELRVERDGHAFKIVGDLGVRRRGGLNSTERHSGQTAKRETSHSPDARVKADVLRAEF